MAKSVKGIFDSTKSFITRVLYGTSKNIRIFAASHKLKFKGLSPAIAIKKSATGANGLTATAQGGEGVGEEEEEEPRSDASSQVESEGSEPPPFYNLYGVAVQCLFCRYYLFPVILVVIF
jgi:hypothetical protein